MTRKKSEARSALEALRAGVVNRSVARTVTYGREAEALLLESHIEKNPAGSCQVLVGEYGIGKSHLVEMLAVRLEGSGYAVARLEMGASHGRAENPRSVAYAIERAISVKIDGRWIQGLQNLCVLIRAIRLPRGMYWQEVPLLAEVHKKLPGRKRLLARYDLLQERIPSFWGAMGNRAVPDLSVAVDVPADMTAANKAVAAINRLANDLGQVGVPGLVLIFDEAERSEWAASAYRQERARNLMLGFGLAAANKQTHWLKHHRNHMGWSYRPEAPSRMHAVFAFTYAWGLSTELARHVGRSITKLAPPTATRRPPIYSQAATGVSSCSTTHGSTAQPTAAASSRISLSRNCNNSTPALISPPNTPIWYRSRWPRPKRSIDRA
jgi:hypothetical protein